MWTTGFLEKPGISALSVIWEGASTTTPSSRLPQMGDICEIDEEWMRDLFGGSSPLASPIIDGGN